MVSVSKKFAILVSVLVSVNQEFHSLSLSLSLKTKNDFSEPQSRELIQSIKNIFKNYDKNDTQFFSFIFVSIGLDFVF